MDTVTGAAEPTVAIAQGECELVVRVAPGWVVHGSVRARWRVVAVCAPSAALLVDLGDVVAEVVAELRVERAVLAAGIRNTMTEASRGWRHHA